MALTAPYTHEIFFRIVPDWLSSQFARLPKDPYLPQGYRFRRLSRFKIEAGEYQRFPHGPYTQDAKRGINTLMGNVERTFEEIEQDALELPELRAMLNRFLAAAAIATSFVFLNVHFIRNVCTKTQIGYPAPEGVHRDGFDIVGILCVAQEHAVGAMTELFLWDDKPPVFAGRLHPGGLLLLDDSKLLHYTSPIEVEDAEFGFRDTVILTANLQDTRSEAHGS